MSTVFRGDFKVDVSNRTRGKRLRVEPPAVPTRNCFIKTLVLCLDYGGGERYSRKDDDKHHQQQFRCVTTVYYSPTTTIKTKHVRHHNGENVPSFFLSRRQKIELLITQNAGSLSQAKILVVVSIG